MLKPLIDYLTFSIKPDANSITPASVDFDFIFSLLSLNDCDFVDIGRKGYYEHCYTCNQIFVYEPYDDKAASQGWCVSMSGQGLRYYEQLQKDGEFVDLWREFFQRLRNLTLSGYSVNVSRIDIAHDDFDGLLNMDFISNAANSREFVSQFRTAYEQGYTNILTGEGMGRTIYFGTRKSSTLCRFYDKKMEQIQKHSNDPAKLQELRGIPHWIRMEFEFKREQAIKIVNLICDCDEFPKLYAEIVNAYVRFVEPVDSNASRCPIKDWWKRFLNTVKRFPLGVGDYHSFSFQRTKRYFEKYLTTTLYTLLSQMTIDELLTSIVDLGANRLKTKHLRIIHGEGREVSYASNQVWDFMNPLPGASRCGYAV